MTASKLWVRGGCLLGSEAARRCEKEQPLLTLSAGSEAARGTTRIGLCRALGRGRSPPAAETTHTAGNKSRLQRRRCLLSRRSRRR